MNPATIGSKRARKLARKAAKIQRRLDPLTGRLLPSAAKIARRLDPVSAASLRVASKFDPVTRAVAGALGIGGRKRRLPFHLRPKRAGEPGPPLPRSRWIQMPGGEYVLAKKDPAGDITAARRYGKKKGEAVQYRRLTDREIRKRIAWAGQYGVKDFFRKTIRYLKKGSKREIDHPAPSIETPVPAWPVSGAAMPATEPTPTIDPYSMPAPLEAPRVNSLTVYNDYQTAPDYPAELVAPPAMDASYQTSVPYYDTDVYDAWGAGDDWGDYDVEPVGFEDSFTVPAGGLGPAAEPWPDDPWYPDAQAPDPYGADPFAGPYQLAGVVDDVWSAVKGYVADNYGEQIDAILSKFKSAVGQFLQNSEKLRRQRATLEAVLRKGDQAGTLPAVKRQEVVSLLQRVEGQQADQAGIEGKIRLVADKLREVGLLKGGEAGLGFVVTTAAAVAAIGAAVTVTAAAWALTKSVRSNDRAVELAAQGVLSPEDLAMIRGSGIGGGLAAVGKAVPWIVAGVAAVYFGPKLIKGRL